jgi:hypothetical protein
VKTDTNIHSRLKPHDEIKNLVNRRDFEHLDLDPIKFKLTDTKDGEGWSHEKVERVAILYRRFLTLIRENPSATIVPTEAIDTFWHYHILDTTKYAEDCNEYFGHFVHHFPYLGLRGDDDVKLLAEAFEITNNLYENRFNESLISTNGLSYSDDPPGCGSVVCGVGTCTAQRPVYKPQLAAA